MKWEQGLRGAWVALIAALTDRITKLMVARFAPDGGVLIAGVVNLRPVQNRGMAFSMLSGQSLALTALTVILIAALAGWLMARPAAPRLFRWGLWMIVGGGIGNLYDRLTRGGVADFIDLAFVRFAVFNMADVFICVGAALALLGAFASDGGERQGR